MKSTTRKFLRKLFKKLSVRFPRSLGLFHSLFPAWILSPQPGIISEKHRLIYIPMQKVASSSIKTSLLTSFDLDINLDPHKAPFQKIPNWKIAAQKDYFIFAFVRNPWDRLVSCYRSKIRPYSTNDAKWINGIPINFWRAYANRFYGGMTFTNFVIEVCRTPDLVSNPHFRSQYYSLAPNGKLLPNFLGRFETLEKDFQEICRITGLPLKLPHIYRSRTNEEFNKPWVKVDYRDYYTKELEGMVRKRYSRDIDFFGYTFDK